MCYSLIQNAGLHKVCYHFHHQKQHLSKHGKHIRVQGHTAGIKQTYTYNIYRLKVSGWLIIEKSNFSNELFEILVYKQL